MRAIEPPVASEPRPPVAITPTMTMAAIATKAASTRQKVSLRRILRRSTITSESSDIEILLKYAARFAFAASPTAYPITSIAMQYEENKARSPLPFWERVAGTRQDRSGRVRGLSPRIETPHPALRATFSHKGRREKQKRAPVET